MTLSISGRRTTVLKGKIFPEIYYNRRQKARGTLLKYCTAHAVTPRFRTDEEHGGLWCWSKYCRKARVDEFLTNLRDLREHCFAVHKKTETKTGTGGGLFDNLSTPRIVE